MSNRFDDAMRLLLRDHAARGLQLLDSRESRQALYRARANGQIT